MEWEVDLRKPLRKLCGKNPDTPNFDLAAVTCRDDDPTPPRTVRDPRPNQANKENYIEDLDSSFFDWDQPPELLVHDPPPPPPPRARPKPLARPAKQHAAQKIIAPPVHKQRDDDDDATRMVLDPPPAPLLEKAKNYGNGRNPKTRITIRTTKAQYDFGGVNPLQKCVSEIMKIIGVTNCIRAEYPEWYEFIVAVLGRHPNAETKLDGMLDLAIKKDRSDHRCLFVVKKDGLVDISVIKAVNGKAPKEPHREDLFQGALRTCIQDQIQKFRHENEPEWCHICGEKIFPSQKVHVDHHQPSFKDLHEKFRLQANLEIPKEYAVQGRMISFLPKDAPIAKKFFQFHSDNANLYYAHVHCNEQKGDRDSIATKK